MTGASSFGALPPARDDRALFAGQNNTIILTRRQALKAALGLPVAGMRAPVLRAAASPVSFRVGDARIQVRFSGGPFALPDETIVHWVQTCARGVREYLGAFPVDASRIEILASDRGGQEIGRSWGEPEAHCRISLPRDAGVVDLNRNWVLTHELFHFAFPSVPDQHRWIEEGLSTYAEPIARAGVGLVTPAQVWGEIVRDMPQGLPRDGDRGLDETHTWGRTYWGGALFWLLADIEVRTRTRNRRGLPDAVRAINQAGGVITAEWPLDRALATGDKGTGTTVLQEQYQRMSSSPFPVDLPALWLALGVQREQERTVFNDAAPLAEIRQGIL